jgi:hypothetical protein
MAKEELDKKTKSPMAKDTFQVLRVLQNENFKSSSLQRKRKNKTHS